MNWKNVSAEDRRAVNNAMTEFGAGSAGARELLARVQAGDRPKPSTISKEVLEVYRDHLQNKYDELSEVRPEKEIEVMRDRLEIYRIWLDDPS